jgi:hypothetical protein
MKADEALDPIAVGLFGPNGIVPQAQNFAKLIEQLQPGIGLDQLTFGWRTSHGKNG